MLEGSRSDWPQNGCGSGNPGGYYAGIMGIKVGVAPELVVVEEVERRGVRGFGARCRRVSVAVGCNRQLRRQEA